MIGRRVHHRERAVAALGLTALTTAQASPERLNWLVRDQWGIEANHWLRDLDWDEGRSQLRRGSAPQIMAGLRNLATGLIRASGRTQIAPTLRRVSRNPVRALILGRPPGWQFLLCTSSWLAQVIRLDSSYHALALSSSAATDRYVTAPQARRRPPALRSREP